MPEGENAPSMEGAKAALESALVAANNDGGTEGNVPAATIPAVEAPAPATETAVETPVVNNLDGIDLSGLDPAIAKQIQDGFLRQQDYTKKTQEIAPLRKLVEEVGDIELLRQSHDFVQRLENDPDFLAEVATKLQEYAPAKEPSTTEVAPVEKVEIPQGADPALIKSINELNEWKQAEQQKQINAELTNQWQEKIQTAEDAIRASNPSYTQSDIDLIYELLPGKEYDMFAAQEQMESLRNRFVNEMVNPKLKHPAEANSPATGSLTTSPVDVNDFAAAAAASRERFRQAT